MGEAAGGTAPDGRRRRLMLRKWPWAVLVLAVGLALLLVLVPRPAGYACIRGPHLGPVTCGTRAYP